MSYIDELRNTPRDTVKSISPQEQELQGVPSAYALMDSIKRISMAEQRRGRNQFQGMLYRVWTQESDNDGGYFNTQWGYDFWPVIVGKQKLTEYAPIMARATAIFPKKYPSTEEFTYTALDVANAMAKVTSAHSGGGPAFYQYKDSIIKLRDDMRNEIVKLGFPSNSVAAIEVSDFKFKVKVKCYKELLSHDIKYKHDVGPLEFTGGSIYGLKIDLKW